MATPIVPPLPKAGSLVTEQAMYLTEISLYRNTFAFGGTRNPSDVWAAMQYNLPPTITYYRELEEKDEDVANCLDSLKLSVTSRARTVQPANEDDSQATEVKEFIEQQLKKVNFDSVLDCILDAPGYGFSVQEMIFDVSMGQASLIEIADCPQELFLFGERWRPQIGQLQMLDNPWMSRGTLVDENKFIITTYRKRGRNRMGRPLLKSVFWPSWIKRNALRLWIQYAEKGPGTAVVRYGDADSDSERKKAAQLAQAIVESTAVGVPKSFDIELDLLKTARAQDPAVYEHLVRSKQYDIARRILGETLTSFGNEGGTGSKSMGDTHAETFNQRSVALSVATEAVVNEQMIRPLVLWNFGPDAPMPELSIEVKEGEDLTERIGVDAGLQRMGKQFTVGYVSERYGVPLAGGENGENPEDILVPNANAPNVAIADQSRATFAERALTRETLQLMDAIRKSSASEESKDHLLRKLMRRHELRFAENNRAAVDAGQQAQRETDEFDRIFNGLRAGAVDVYKQRVRELADSASASEAD